MTLRDFALMVVVCLIWASSNVVSKYVVSHLGVPPLFFAGVRFVLVALATVPWLLPAPKPLWRILTVGVLMGAGNFALLFIGLKTATPSSAAIVSQIGAPLTAVMSFLMLGETMNRRRIFGVSLTALGVILVMWDPRGFHASMGLLFVLAAAFLGSLGAVMMKQMEGVKPLQFQAWGGFSSAVPLLIASALFEPGAIEPAAAAGWKFAAAVGFSAIVVSVAAHTAYYGLIQRYEANLVSPLTLMTPLFTIGMGVLFMHDPFGPRMALGTIVALAGVLIVALRFNQLVSLALALRPRAQ